MASKRKLEEKKKRAVMRQQEMAKKVVNRLLGKPNLKPNGYWKLRGTEI